MIGYCRTPNSDLQKCPPCLALQKSVIQPHKMYTCSSLWWTCGNYFIMTWIPVYSGAQHNESENRKWLLRIYQSRFFSESNLLRTLCGGNTDLLRWWRRYSHRTIVRRIGDLPGISWSYQTLKDDDFHWTEAHCMAPWIPDSIDHVVYFHIKT